MLDVLCDLVGRERKAFQFGRMTGEDLQLKKREREKEDMFENINSCNLVLQKKPSYVCNFYDLHVVFERQKTRR